MKRLIKILSILFLMFILENGVAQLLPIPNPGPGDQSWITETLNDPTYVPGGVGTRNTNNTTLGYPNFWFYVEDLDGNPLNHENNDGTEYTEFHNTNGRGLLTLDNDAVFRDFILDKIRIARGVLDLNTNSFWDPLSTDEEVNVFFAVNLRHASHNTSHEIFSFEGDNDLGFTIDNSGFIVIRAKPENSALQTYTSTTKVLSDANADGGLHNMQFRAIINRALLHGTNQYRTTVTLLWDGQPVTFGSANGVTINFNDVSGDPMKFDRFVVGDDQLSPIQSTTSNYREIRNVILTKSSTDLDRFFMGSALAISNGVSPLEYNFPYIRNKNTSEVVGLGSLNGEVKTNNRSACLEVSSSYANGNTGEMALMGHTYVTALPTFENDFNTENLKFLDQTQLSYYISHNSVSSRSFNFKFHTNELTLSAAAFEPGKNYVLYLTDQPEVKTGGTSVPLVLDGSGNLIANGVVIQDDKYLSIAEYNPVCNTQPYALQNDGYSNLTGHLFSTNTKEITVCQGRQITFDVVVNSTDNKTVNLTSDIANVLTGEQVSYTTNGTQTTMSVTYSATYQDEGIKTFTVTAKSGNCPSQTYDFIVNIPPPICPCDNDNVVTVLRHSQVEGRNVSLGFHAKEGLETNENIVITNDYYNDPEPEKVEFIAPNWQSQEASALASTGKDRAQGTWCVNARLNEPRNVDIHIDKTHFLYPNDVKGYQQYVILINSPKGDVEVYPVEYHEIDKETGWHEFVAKDVMIRPSSQYANGQYLTIGKLKDFEADNGSFVKPSSLLPYPGLIRYYDRNGSFDEDNYSDIRSEYTHSSYESTVPSNRYREVVTDPYYWFPEPEGAPKFRALFRSYIWTEQNSNLKLSSAADDNSLLFLSIPFAGEHTANMYDFSDFSFSQPNAQWYLTANTGSGWTEDRTYRGDDASINAQSSGFMYSEYVHYNSKQSIALSNLSWDKGSGFEPTIPTKYFFTNPAAYYPVANIYKWAKGRYYLEAGNEFKKFPVMNRKGVELKMGVVGQGKGMSYGDYVRLSHNNGEATAFEQVSGQSIRKLNKTWALNIATSNPDHAIEFNIDFETNGINVPGGKHVLLVSDNENFTNVKIYGLDSQMKANGLKLGNQFMVNGVPSTRTLYVTVGILDFYCDNTYLNSDYLGFASTERLKTGQSGQLRIEHNFENYRFFGEDEYMVFDHSSHNLSSITDFSPSPLNNVLHSNREWCLQFSDQSPTNIMDLQFSISETDLLALSPADYQVPAIIIDGGTDGYLESGLIKQGDSYVSTILPIKSGYTARLAFIHKIADASYSSGPEGIGMATYNYKEGNGVSSQVSIESARELQAREYLLLGHNGLDFNPGTKTPEITPLVNRVWKVQEHGDVGGVDLRFDLPQAFGEPEADHFYLLLVADNPLMNNASPVALYKVEGEAYMSYDVNLSNGDYLTLGYGKYLVTTEKDHTCEVLESNQNAITNSESCLTVLHDEETIDIHTNGPCPTMVDKVFLEVTVDFGEDYELGDLPLSHTVSLDVKGYDDFTTQVADEINFYNTLGTIDLEINQTTPEKVYRIDITDYYEQTKQLEITPSSSSLPLSTRVLTNIKVEQRTKVHRTSYPMITTNTPVNQTGSRLYTLSWETEGCEAPAYQVEVLRLYNLNEQYTTEQAIEAEVNWDRALHLDVLSQQSVTLTMMEGTGYYLWRVRPVGDFYPEGDNRNWGAWSSAQQNGIITLDQNDISSINEAFHFTDPEEGMNYIYSRTFTEGGRVSENMLYANGLQQVQQNQTRLPSNVNQQVIASQSVYDFSGRAALQALPVPLDQNELMYESGVMLKGTEPFRDKHFDSDDNYANPSGNLSNVTGGKVVDYYDNSSSNQISSTEGFPYSRSLFDTDGSGRVIEAGSVGSNLIVGQDKDAHTVRLKYTTATDDELIRIFGDEAPAGNTVIKQVTLDQNNVASVAYIDKTGKTIATNLTKTDLEVPLTELDDPDKTPFAALQPVKLPTSSDGFQKAGEYTYVFVEDDQEITIQYDLTPQIISNVCGDYCASCGYEVRMVISSYDAEPAFSKVYETSIPMMLDASNSCQSVSVTLNETVLSDTWVASAQKTYSGLTKGKYKIDFLVKISDNEAQEMAEAFAKDEADAFNSYFTDLRQAIDNMISDNPTVTMDEVMIQLQLLQDNAGLQNYDFSTTLYKISEQVDGNETTGDREVITATIDQNLPFGAYELHVEPLGTTCECSVDIPIYFKGDNICDAANDLDTKANLLLEEVGKTLVPFAPNDAIITTLDGLPNSGFRLPVPYLPTTGNFQYTDNEAEAVLKNIVNDYGDCPQVVNCSRSAVQMVKTVSKLSSETNLTDLINDAVNNHPDVSSEFNASVANQDVYYLDQLITCLQPKYEGAVNFNNPLAKYAPHKVIVYDDNLPQTNNKYQQAQDVMCSVTDDMLVDELPEDFDASVNENNGSIDWSIADGDLSLPQICVSPVCNFNYTSSPTISYFNTSGSTFGDFQQIHTTSLNGTNLNAFGQLDYLLFYQTLVAVWNGSEAPPSYDASAYPQKQLDELNQLCEDACDRRYEDFLYNLETEVFVKTTTGWLAKDGSDLAQSDLNCTAQSMVEECQRRCDFSATPVVCSGTTVGYTVGNQDEMSYLQQVIGGTYEVELPENSDNTVYKVTKVSKALIHLINDVLENTRHENNRVSNFVVDQDYDITHLSAFTKYNEVWRNEDLPSDEYYKYISIATDGAITLKTNQGTAHTFDFVLDKLVLVTGWSLHDLRKIVSTQITSGKLYTTIQNLEYESIGVQESFNTFNYISGLTSYKVESITPIDNDADGRFHLPSFFEVDAPNATLTSGDDALININDTYTYSTFDNANTGSSAFNTELFDMIDVPDGFILIGETRNPLRIFIKKIDLNGNQISEVSFFGTDPVITKKQDGTGFLVGYSIQGKDFKIRTYNNNLTVQTGSFSLDVVEYGFQYLHQILEYNGFYYIIARSTTSISSLKSQQLVNGNKYDLWVMKFTHSGELIWERSFNGTEGNVYPHEALVDSEGSILIASLTNSENGNSKSQGKSRAGANVYNPWLIKVDAEGNLMWEKTLLQSEVESQHQVSGPKEGFVRIEKISDDEYLALCPYYIDHSRKTLLIKFGDINNGTQINYQQLAFVERDNEYGFDNYGFDILKLSNDELYIFESVFYGEIIVDPRLIKLNSLDLSEDHIIDFNTALFDQSTPQKAFKFDYSDQGLFLHETYYNDESFLEDKEWNMYKLGYPTCAPQPVTMKWNPVRPLRIPDLEAEEVTFEELEAVKARDIVRSLESQLNSCREVTIEKYKEQYKNTCLNDANVGLSTGTDLVAHHYTLYYYDRAGNLVETVPPAGVNTIDQISRDAEGYAERNISTNHDMQTKYEYNSLGQLVSQKIPDHDDATGNPGGETNFIYNEENLLRFSQNPQQVVEGTFSYSKYDALGRIIEVGEAQLPLNTNFADLSVPKYMGGHVIIDAPNYKVVQPFYGIGSFPVNSTHPTFSQSPLAKTTINEVTFTFYTEGESSAFYLYPEEQNGTMVMTQKPQRFLRNRISHTYRDADGDVNATNGHNDQVHTYFSYDPHGNVEWMVCDIPGIGRNQVAYKYDLISRNVLLVSYNEGTQEQFYHRYSYDADNRIQQVETSRDKVIWDRDAQYEYYAHGPMKRTLLGEDKIQGMDYTYTAQGWLKALNHPLIESGLAGLETNGDPGQDGVGTSKVAKDVYGQQLGYFQGDFVKAGSVFDAGYQTTHTPSTNQVSLDPFQLATDHANKPLDLYNGNIAYITRKTMDHPLQSNGLTGNLTTEQYRYDYLNRLVAMNTLSVNATDGSWENNNDFATTYKYDGNGNLTNLTRTAFGGEMFDNIHYGYETANLHATDPTQHNNSGMTNNRLARVNDLATGLEGGSDLTQNLSSNANYTYDKIGNLTGDAQEGINNIEWTVSGKVSKIEKEDGEIINFLYDPSGNRVGKFSESPSGLISKTYYVRDASGNSMATYQEWQGGTPPVKTTQCALPALESCYDGGAPVDIPACAGEVLTGSGSVSIATGETKRFDDGFTGTVELDGGEFYVCADLGDLAITSTANKGKVILTHSVTRSTGFAFQGDLDNYGTLTLSSDLNWNIGDGTFTNYGVLYVPNLNLSGTAGAKLINYGTIIVGTEETETATATIDVELVNHGELVVYGTLNSLTASVNNDGVVYGANVNFTGQLINTCGIRSTGDIEIVALDNNVLTGDLNEPGEVSSLMVTPKVTCGAENNALPEGLYLTEQSIYGSDRLGVRKPETGAIIRGATSPLVWVATDTYARTLTRKQYEVKDHLGNVRAVLTDRKLVADVSTFEPEVVAMTDYYPFGWAMPGRQVSSADYRYGFNGKEKTNEVYGEGVVYDYGFRIYDSRIGKFCSLDPLADNFSWNSPYSFAENQPIWAVDLDGLEKNVIIRDIKTGHVMMVIKADEELYGTVDMQMIAFLGDKWNLFEKAIKNRSNDSDKLAVYMGQYNLTLYAEGSIYGELNFNNKFKINYEENPLFRLGHYYDRQFIRYNGDNLSPIKETYFSLEFSGKASFVMNVEGTYRFGEKLGGEAINDFSGSISSDLANSLMKLQEEISWETNEDITKSLDKVQNEFKKLAKEYDELNVSGGIYLNIVMTDVGDEFMRNIHADDLDNLKLNGKGWTVKYDPETKTLKLGFGLEKTVNASKDY